MQSKFAEKHWEEIRWPDGKEKIHACQYATVWPGEEGAWRQSVGLRAIKVIGLVDGADNQIILTQVQSLQAFVRCYSDGLCYKRPLL
jgi:hypothetical protein